MKRIIHLAVISAGIAVSGLIYPVQATDYYVSSVHASRSDSNPGTSSNAPWATFDKIKSAWGTTIKAGDTVHLGKGSTWTWSANVYWTISQGGNSSAGSITIRGDDFGSGTPPVIRRTGIAGGNGGQFIHIVSGGYITIRNFVIDNGSDLGYVADGVLIGGYNQSSDISNITIMNMTIRNIGNLSAYYSSGIQLGANNSHVISNCLVENNDISGYTAHGINIYGYKSGTTPNYHNNNIFRNNRIYNSSPNRYPNTGSGIHISFGGSGNVYEYNYIEGDNLTGLMFLMNCANNESGLIIRYNVLKNNSVGSGIVFGPDSSGGENSVVTCDIYGNIIVGCNRSGISFESQNWFTGTVNIFNNTFYNNGQFVSSFGGEILIWDQNSLNINMVNNILVHLPKSGSSATCLYVHSGYSGSLTHRNNVYWHTSGGSALAAYVKGTTYTVSSIKNYEPTAQNADPLFTDAGQIPTAVSSATGPDRNGFALPLSSLGVDRGAALGSVYAKSINLVTRPQGAAWDIGAYEYGSATPVPQVPAAPSSLTATALSTNQVRLRWQDNATNETGFKIERSLDGVSFSQFATVGVNVTNHVDVGLTAGTTYYYRICSYFMNGDSAYSSVMSAAPGELIVDDGSSAFSTVSGQDAWVLYENPAGMHYGGAHHYNVLIDNGLDVARWSFTVPASGTYDVYAWWYEAATRPPDVPYTVYYSGGSATVKVDQRVNGGRWNLLGSYPFSTTGSVTVSDAASSGTDLVADSVRLVYRSSAMPGVSAPPAAPSGLTATANSTNQITLGWLDNATNETGFAIERGTNASVFVQIATVGSNVTNYVNTALVPNATYYYRVRAINAATNSAYVTVVSATTLPVPTVPAAPSGLTATVTATNQIVLAWTDNAVNEMGFRIERGLNASAFSQIASAVSNASSFTSTGLSASVTYYYRVSATNAAGDSGYANIASATTPTLVTAPAAPSGLTAVQNSPSQITLAWTDNSGNEAGFKIERGTNGTTFTQITTVGSNITNYANTGLLANITYYYRVRANNAVGDSAYANVASATTPGLAPAAPSGLTALPTASNQITLAWRDNSDNETGFKIERSTDGVSFSQIAVAGSNSSNYVHSAVAVGVTNYYRVCAVNAMVESGYAPVAFAVIGVIVVNDADPGFSVVEGQDAWVPYQDQAGQHYLGSHRYNHAPGTGADTATWSFIVPFIGMYDVYVWWWDGAWRPPDVPYTVNYYGGSMTVKMDQRTNGGKWNLLGTFPLSGTNSVMVSDAVSSGGDVVVDAVRIILRPDLPVTVPMPPTGLKAIP